MSRKRRTRAASDPAWGRISDSADWVSVAQKRARRKRYYCPSCGMAREVNPDSLEDHEEVIGDYVMPHYKTTGPTVGEKDFCPGGRIDLEKDRAP